MKTIQKYLKRHRFRWVVGLFGAAFLMGCGKQIPKEIIQPEQMEGILYDYHLSLSLGTKLSYADTYKKEAYKNYVFQKHGITEAEFDSSMVWYTRHTEELAEIYHRLGERFRSEKKQMQHLLMLRENKPVTTESGDTVDIWYDRKLYWMTDAPLAHRILFEIPADSNFYPRDRFVWTADYHFLAESQCQATMGFNVLFDNDSIIGKVVHVTHSGRKQLEIQSDSAYAIKKVSGFVYYTSGDSSKQDPGLVLNDLHLIRYHELEPDSTAVADSLNADKSLKPVSPSSAEVTPKNTKQSNPSKFQQPVQRKVRAVESNDVRVAEPKPVKLRDAKEGSRPVERIRRNNND